MAEDPVRGHEAAMNQDPSLVPEEGCGQRLRKAREAAGLSVAEVGARLKMPVRVVRSLEEEDWSRLGAPVFIRGQLRSYSRLLGLTTEPMMQAAGVAPVEPPRLQPRTYTPAIRRYAEMAARRFVYIVLTAAIAVPVWLATRSHLGEVARDAAPLDAPALGTRDPHPQSAGERNDPGTVVASIASLPPRQAPRPELVFRFGKDSWVDISSRDGAVLEHGLVPAGEERRFPQDEVGSVVLGNASAVELRAGDRTLDLAPFRRANVARFKVSSDGSLAPAAD